MYANEKFPFTQILELHALAVKNELSTIIKQQRHIPSLADISPEQQRIVRGNLWKTFFLLAYGYEVKTNIIHAPITYSLVKQIPGVTMAFFSIMEPHTHLLPHRGPYKGVLRCHLALILPRNPSQSWIVIDGKKYFWEEGKCMVFDDTFIHEAVNDSDDIRVVLFIDFKRNLPAPVSWLNSFLIALIGASPFVQNVLKEIEKDN